MFGGFGVFGGGVPWPPPDGNPIGDFGSPGAPPPLGAVNNPMHNHNRNAQ
jgi:hypothetical protein